MFALLRRRRAASIEAYQAECVDWLRAAVKIEHGVAFMPDDRERLRGVIEYIDKLEQQLSGKSETR